MDWIGLHQVREGNILCNTWIIKYIYTYYCVPHHHGHIYTKGYWDWCYFCASFISFPAPYQVSVVSDWFLQILPHMWLGSHHDLKSYDCSRRMDSCYEFSIWNFANVRWGGVDDDDDANDNDVRDYDYDDNYDNNDINNEKQWQWRTSMTSKTI